MDKQISNDIKKLNKGVLPEAFNFSIKPNPIDWDKVRYNSLYKDFEYYENKFPDGYKSIPYFEKIIQAMADNAKSPLDEIEELKNKSSDR